MNRQLSSKEIEELSSVVTTTMTRNEKLLHWAAIIAKSKTRLQLYHGLEFFSAETLNHIPVDNSAFALAAKDPIFKDAGFKGESVGEGMRFFELSQAELHEFSCGCGGAITNREMAKRIQKLAGVTGPVAAIARFLSAK